MATLLKKVSQNLQRTQSGQLVAGASPLPTQELAAQAGMPAAPTTPGGVAMLGGTPDQAKMAGTTPQKQTALRQSTDQVNTLQEATADKKARTAQTSEEQDMAERTLAAKQAFGETQVKVSQLVTAAMTTPADTSKVQLNAPADFKPAAGYDKPKVDSAFTAAVNITKQLMQGKTKADDPKVQQAINALRMSLGNTDLAGSSEQIKAMNAAITAAAQKQIETEGSQAAATNVADIEKMGAAALLPQLLPDVPPEQQRQTMADILGVTPEQIDTMTVAQLDQAVKVMEEQGDRSSTDIARSKSLAGQAELEELSAQEQDLSAAGVTAYEQELDTLGSSLENADIINVLGEDMTLEKVLSDDFLVGKIKEYLTAAPGSDLRKKMEADPNMKGLVNFMNGYSKVLTDAVSSLEKAGAANVDIQTSNVNVGKFGDSKLPDSIMEKIYPNWGKLADAKYKKEKLVAALARMPKEQQASIVQDITTIVSDAKYKELIPQFADLVALDVNHLFKGEKGNRMVDRLVGNITKRQDIDKNKNNVDYLVDTYFSGASGTKDLQAFVDQESDRALLGLGTDNITSKLLDTDGDGKLDSDVGSRLYKGLSDDVRDADSVGDVIKGGTVNPKHQLNTSGMSPEQQVVLSHLGGPNIKKNGLQAAVLDSLNLNGKIDFDTDLQGLMAGDALDFTTEADMTDRSRQLIFERFGNVPDLNYLESLKSIPLSDYKKNPGVANRINASIEIRKFVDAMNAGQQPDAAWTERVIKLLAGTGNFTSSFGNPETFKSPSEQIDMSSLSTSFVPGQG